MKNFYIGSTVKKNIKIQNSVLRKMFATTDFYSGKF
jgi:hypothetical protein